MSQDLRKKKKKNNGLLKYTTWMNPQKIMLSENKSNPQKLHMV